jgi:hypothetical protein
MMKLPIQVLLLVSLGIPGEAQPLSPQQWQADLSYLSDHLTRLHMNFFAHLSPNDFTAAVNRLNGAIPSMTASLIRASMSQLVAMGQDSHTMIFLNGASQTFPFTVAHFADGWYVTAIDPSQSDKVGGSSRRSAAWTPTRCSMLRRRTFRTTISRGS